MIGHEVQKQTIVVDRSRCTGIGICESLAPEHFEVGDDGAVVLLRDVFGDTDRDEVETAVRSCPAKALRIERAG